MTTPNVFSALSDYRIATDTSLTNTQSAQGTLAAQVNSTSGTPFWVSPFDGDDVSTPWSEAVGSFTPTASIIYLAPVIIGKDGYRDTIRIAGATVTITSVYTGLYSVDRASGTLTLVWDSGDIQTAYNTTYRTGDVVSVPMPSINVSQGDAFMVAVMQRGASGTVGAVYARAAQTGVTLRTTSNAFPSRLGNATTAAWTSIAAVPTIYPFGISTPAYDTGPSVWMALGIGTIPVGAVTYSDAFYRANSAVLAPLWTHRYTNGSGELRVVSQGVAPPSGSTSDYVSTYDLQMHHTDHTVSITAGTGSGNTPTHLYLHLRSSDTNQCFAKWDVSAGTCNIYTSTAWGITGTSRASGSAGTTFKSMQFQAVGQDYTLTMTELDGTQTVLPWNDSGVVHPVDSTQRIVGMGLAAPAPVRTYVDNFLAQDL